MDRLCTEAEKLAVAVVTAAGPGETVEARTSRLTRRKHRVVGERIRTAQTVTGPAPTTVRLARRGRDAYLGVEHLHPTAVTETLADVRAVMKYARPFRSVAALRPSTDWAEDQHVDGALDRSDEPLRRLWQNGQRLAAEVGEQLGLQVRVLEALVNQQQQVEAFARTNEAVRTFRRTLVETRLRVEVRQGQRRMQLWTARHTNRLDQVPVANLLQEAALRSAALLARSGGASSDGSGSGPLLLLGPRPAAHLVRALAHDLFDGFRAPPPDESLRHLLIDDAHATAGPHSRPYDHEGSPTGETVLVDQHGRPARFTVRGSDPGGPGLTGNAYLLPDRGTPEPAPTNVRLAPVVPPKDDLTPESFTGLYGYNLRGDGTQRFRAGEVLRFRVEAAQVRGGVVCGRTPDLRVTATAAQLLAAVRQVAPAVSYLPWPTYSTADAWVLLDGVGRFVTLDL